MSPNRKEYKKSYNKAYYQAHKDEVKAQHKAWKEANKDKVKEYNKSYNKAYYQAHKDEVKAQHKAYHKAYSKDYYKADVNALGQTKGSIRMKSIRILRQMNLKISGYEIHHCFGYEDPSKFIYISKALHLKIHQYLRDNNIEADSNHWLAIRDIVNSTDEFTYVKC